jgi:hypothetical protein
MSLPLITYHPEPLVSERRLPVRAGVVEVTHVAPAVSDALFGLPVVVEGRGPVGQYIGHQELVRMGEEHWLIDFGVVVVYALVEGERSLAVIPVSFNGFTTPDVVDALRRGQRMTFYAHVRRRGQLLTPKRAIVNLQEVVAGRDVAIRVDPAGLTAVRTDEELREQYLRLHEEYTRLVDVALRLQRTNTELESRVRMSEAQLLTLRAFLDDLVVRLSYYQVQLTKHEATISDALRRMQRMQVEVATEKELRSRLETLLRDVAETMESASTAIRALRELIESAVKLPKAEEEAEEEKGAAAAGGAAGGGGGGGAEQG